ncbi:hypothetical protein BLNAU_6615 [Blattamonas nauphoetae]|uniref:Uncharacterized protein n=1 Tax=Blattamonas nauphoetae TaxID=2049346 RepID=A0ABQ9Y3L3_9EUKA|nr:hypothetical protein BLNAU_6615 [Blattamonas nauphoetae]
MSADTPPPNATHSDVDFQDFEQARQIIASAKKREMEALQEAERAKQALQRKEEEEKKQKQREDEEKKQQERKQANLNIIKAQSETITLIKALLQLVSPKWFDYLSKFISDFFLLNDGHILFSKTWLKNDVAVLSTPLLFRPVYNIILYHVLRFICDFFKSGGPKERPGHAFYIAGDQGIGKTSLMLILMSTLSHRSHDFLYEKGFKGGDPQLFFHSKSPNGPFRFVEISDDDDDDKIVSRVTLYKQSINIHIHDDCPPPAIIRPNHLHFIFTSPDPLRLPPPKKKENTSPNEQPQPSSPQKQAQKSPPPEPSSNHLCHIFRLPTFSLAEDAVAMVGCTPTAPFALLSPEDMQLRTRDQKILLSIESEKEDVARRLPEASVDKTLPSKNSAVETQLKALLGDGWVSSTKWNSFCTKFWKKFTSRAVTVEAKPKPSQKSTKTRRKAKQTEHAQIVARQEEEEEKKQEEKDNDVINTNLTSMSVFQTLKEFNQEWMKEVEQEEEFNFNKSSTDVITPTEREQKEHAQIVTSQQEEDLWQARETYRRKEEEKKRKKEADLNIVVTPPISHIAQGSSVNMKQALQEWEEYRDRFVQAPQKRKEEAKGKEEEEGKQEEVIEDDLNIVVTPPISHIAQGSSVNMKQALQEWEEYRDRFVQAPQKRKEEAKGKEEEEGKQEEVIEDDLNIVVTPPISHIAQGSSVNMKQALQEWEEYRDRFVQAPQKRKEEAKGKEEEEGKQEEVIEDDLNIVVTPPISHIAQGSSVNMKQALQEWEEYRDRFVQAPQKRKEDTNQKRKEAQKIDRFYTSLRERIPKQSVKPPGNDSIIAVVDWLMKQLELPPGRNKEQASFIKDLIHELVLLEWNQSKQESENAQKAKAAMKGENTQKEGGEDEQEAEEIITEIEKCLEEQGKAIDSEDTAAATKGENDQKVGGEDTDTEKADATSKGTTAAKKKGKNKNSQEQMTPAEIAARKKEKDERERERELEITNALFALAMSYAPKPPDLIGEIQEFSDLIQKVKLTDPQTPPSLQDLTNLSKRLKSLKKHLEESDISEDVNLQQVREEVKKICDRVGEDNKTRRNLLYKALIDMVITPPWYDSHKPLLQSLFVVPKLDDMTTDINLRPHLGDILDQSRSQPSDNKALDFIIQKLIDNLNVSQTSTRIACDLLMTILKTPIAPVTSQIMPVVPKISFVNPLHFNVETRLRSVQNRIKQIQNELSFVSYMETFFFIARDMNILVTPHSILKGLSERIEKPKLKLNDERKAVYCRNLRDEGLSDWIKNATATLLPRPGAPKKSPLEVQLSIQRNLNEVITTFNTKYQPSEGSVINRKWLAIVRSMMNTILYLIDAGATRREILDRYGGLRQLLTTVYKSNQDHLLRVAAYPLNQKCEEPKSDYVNDRTVISNHFHAQKPLSLLELPRTLQLAPLSQDRLEQMTVALFARNQLCFLEMEDDLRFDDDSYVELFYTEFLQQLNPGDVVHRSFVDFMNATHLLSQKNFGVTPDDFPQFLENEHPELKSKKASVQTTRETRSLVEIMTERITLQVADPEQPFQDFSTRQFGVHLLLWASSDLLLKAACGTKRQESGTDKTTESLNEELPSEDSGDEKTGSPLNVARASIFGPSPRWLTSTDARTNRGLAFLWGGVLKSESATALIKVADSNHSRIMEFNTERFFFENSMDAAWDDIAALVPLFRHHTKDQKPPKHISSVFSLMVNKTPATIEQMKSLISFMAVSPFMELILQSEVVAALAKLMTQAKYNEFKEHQTIYGFKLPEYVEEPLVCISFLLNCPTPINLSSVSTSFHKEYIHLKSSELFCQVRPFFSTTSSQITSMPMLIFPNLSNQSVEGTEFPLSLIETGRGKTDFYAEDLQGTKRPWEGFDSLIVSRGIDETSETIFMPIQATTSKTHSLVEGGILLIQQLLFQAMCHLEPSEPIVAMYNYATTQRNPTFPSQTGILGFHMVSSHLEFDKNTLTHLSSILRHRDQPFITTPTVSQTTMTTQDIANTLLANLPPYPTFAENFGPWRTKLSLLNNPAAPYLSLPYRWKQFYDILQKSSPILITHNRMVRRTIQELHRIGVCPSDLGETELTRKETFSSFLLCFATSRRRKDLLDPPATTDSLEDDHNFVTLVQSVIGSDESETIKDILAPFSHQPDINQLDSLYRENCIQTRLHTVYRVMTNNAMKRLRNPAQECLSVLQSENDGGVFRVPAQNNLSAILHCGTVLLDNINPLSPTVSDSLHQSRTFRLPLHSFVLAKYGFSNSIPSLSELKQDEVKEEVTDVTPSPLIRWHPRRVVIDTSLLPSNILQADTLPYFTTFIHRLFDDPFIPVSTSLSTVIQDNRHDTTFILSQIRKIENILTSLNLEENPDILALVTKLSALKEHQQAFTVFSHLPEIQSCSQSRQLSSDQRDVIRTTIESIEAIQQQPTLVFVKSGSDFFPPSTEDPEFVDIKTEAYLFPIPFSTGYKEGELREELKQIYEPLTQLLPKRFPTGRPSLSPLSLSPLSLSPLSLSPLSLSPLSLSQPSFSQPIFSSLSLSRPQDGPNKEQRKSSPSKEEADNRARVIMNSLLHRIGETPITPLFVFDIDETLPIHESLPMSLRLNGHGSSWGMMRQRSLADVLWILFLTRISREVMALSLNTSVGPTSLTKHVIPFLANTLRLQEIKLPIQNNNDLPSVLNSLIDRAADQHINDDNRISNVGLELLVSAFQHAEDEPLLPLLSHLLMLCPSRQPGETRLDALINHPSPTVELDTLIRWFELLPSKTQPDELKVAINKGGFSPAKIRENLLRAFYLIIEHEREDLQLLVRQLDTAIRLILDETNPLFFDERDRQTLHDYKDLINMHYELNQEGSSREGFLNALYVLIDTILINLKPDQPNPQGA